MPLSVDLFWYVVRMFSFFQSFTTRTYEGQQAEKAAGREKGHDEYVKRTGSSRDSRGYLFVTLMDKNTDDDQTSPQNGEGTKRGHLRRGMSIYFLLILEYF
jgi:hypothetical protein